MVNPHIKCSVKSCKHNDQTKYCCLDAITVGNNNCATAHEKRETECDSFEDGCC